MPAFRPSIWIAQMIFKLEEKKRKILFTTQELKH